MRFVPRVRHRSSRLRLRHHAAFFSVVMLVMVLAPLGGKIATAQEGGAAQATEEPPPPEATEEPAEGEQEPQIDPTEAPVSELIGSIEIDYWECPDASMLQDPDLDALYETCAGVNGIPFSISTSDGGNRSQQTGEYGDAHVSFTNLPTGMTAISGPGGVSTVWCNGIVQHGGAETGYQPLDASGGTIAWNLQDDEIVFCSWLTVPDTASATTGTFQLDYRTCPEGYAFLDASIRSQLDIMLLDCDAETNIEFALDQAGTNGSPRATGDDGDGRVVFDGVPAGMRTLRQTSPWGDANTYVVCEGIQQPGGTSTGLMVMDDANGTIQWDLKEGQVVSCGWFVGDAMPVPDTGGDVVIRYHECPQGTDFATLPEGDLAATCTGTVDGVVFRAISGGQYDVSAATGDRASSEVSFDNVVPGLIYVKQVSPVKQMIVICQSDGAVSPPTRVPVTQAQIEWVLQEGETLTCDWYVIPAPGAVTIQTWACGSGADPGMTADEAAVACGNFPGLVDFTLTNRNHAQTVTTTDYIAAFIEVPPGQVVVGMDPGVSVADSIVRCEVRDLATNDVLVPMAEFPVSGATPDPVSLSITLTLGSAQSVACEWYLVPVDATDDGNARLELATYACNPAAVPDDAERYEEFITLCAPETIPVRFTVTGVNQFVRTRTIATSGFVENIPPGDITIAPMLPDGTGKAIAFCSGRRIDATEYELDWGAYVPDDTGAIDYTISANFHITCAWFLIGEPADTSGDLTIVIDKWHCPEGTEYGREADHYETACTEPHVGVDFRITHANGTASGTTSDTGHVAFAGLPVGQTGIQEIIPAGYGDPVVSCVLHPTGTPDTIIAGPFTLEAPGGYGSVDPVEDGNHYTIACRWYNIPAGHNSVTVWKYACPEWYDPHAWDADPGRDCTEPLDGVTFTISGAATGLSDQTRDGDVSFDALSSGTYTITEDLPEGYASSFIWECQGQRSGELRPSPLSTGTTLTLTLDGGEDVSCRWYNILEPHGGTLVVIAYTCVTGTFVSDVDCEIEEDGVGFDLVRWDGDEWDHADSGTTDGSGVLRFTGLDAGEYWLDQEGGDWCWLASDNLSDDGNWLDVAEGEETVVHVYTCGGTPGKPGEMPVKYPNTGVMPQERNHLP